ncbi:type VI secretion system membrane subunit TssM [Acidomonas methanolica]|uniref:type VI secretion system membrane subunit TssM n=1 Tax=Acidomonas methanolica TaxID=437 RepID=UPI00211A7D1D|nr:type VI secretion system membrane subunit TssM [Acidomonas methanolica]
MNVFYVLLSAFQRFVGSRWTQALSVSVLLTGLLWLYLPLLAMFLPVWRRIVAIGVVWLVVFAVAFLMQRRRNRQEAGIDAVLTDGGSGERAATPGARGKAQDEAGAAEVRELRRRLSAAIAMLRKHGVRRLYDLPWYVLIGPPGSGKTTALRHSGLHFPLGEEGEDSLRGVGGTRLCDWWFADEAVLIDTAGRYTTQDSDRASDQAGWLGFLDALRRARPRQPVNGVIVMISVLDIVAASPEARAAHARQVRLRIKELTEKFGVRTPVYLIFNKIDRLAGFQMFFDDLDEAGRAQVWGVTFPVDGGIDRFPAEFAALVERLDRRLIDRLQAERAQDRRALMSGFPLQVASLADPIRSFLDGAFRDSRLDQAPFLRGVYLTSAAQVGAPLDRLSGALARSFGIDQKRSGPAAGPRGRAYFLSRLVHDVILGEALLGAYAPERYRRRKLTRAVALSGIGVLTLFGVAVIWRSHMEARAMVQAQFARFAAYHDVVAPLAGQTVAGDADLPAVSDALDRARALATASASGGLAGWLAIAPDEAAVEAGRTAYENALARLLYPRLLWRLEHDMRARFQDPAFLYDATRAYLLLGGFGPHDPQIVQSWFAAEWERRYAGTLNHALRERLGVHLAALLDRPAPDGVTLDGDLVRRARIAFGHITPAQRIYGRLRDLPIPAGVHDWSPQSALGTVGDEVFARRSGAPLSDGVPGFFTGAGYAEIIRRQLPAAAHAVANESWVMGHDPALSVRGNDASALEREVAELWVADARARWAATLNDLTIHLGSTPSEVTGALYLLSSPQSPLRDMVRAIVSAQTIPMPVPARTATGATSGETDALDPVDSVASEWNSSLSPMTSLLHGNNGVAPPMETITALIGHLDNAVATGGGIQQGQAGSFGAGMPDPGQRLRAEASRQMEPVATWLREIADAGEASRGQEVRAASSGAFNGVDGPGNACKSLVKGHFPFDPDSPEDAPLDGFVRVFAPGGLLDRYVEQSVAPFVDRSGRIWRVRDADGVRAPYTAGQLASFQRIAAIRHAFFPVAGPPFLSLTVTFRSGPDIALTLGATKIRPDAPTTLSWPGSDGLSPAVISLTRGGRTTVLERGDGPWGLARLLHKGISQPAPGGGRDVVYPDGEELAATGNDIHDVATPFDLLAGFSCPDVP